MKTYPIMLNVAGRLCVVVGAGPVGLRRAEALARAGASVRLVDPDAAGAAGEGIERVRAPYAPPLLDGAMLVFACTDDAALNGRIAADARSAGALVNVADDPGRCDFFAAATVADGDVVVAVGTGGASPALARALKEKIAGQLPERIGDFAAALQEVRARVHRRISDPRQRLHVLKGLVGRGGYETFLRGGVEGLTEMADAAIEAMS